MFPFLLLYTLVARLITCDSSILILFGKSIDTSIGFFLFPLYGYRLGFILFSSFYTIKLDSSHQEHHEDKKQLDLVDVAIQ